MDTPPNTTITLTPASSHNVFATYSGSTVAARCAQVPCPGASTFASTTTTGTASRIAISVVSTGSAPA